MARAKLYQTSCWFFGMCGVFIIIEHTLFFLFFISLDLFFQVIHQKRKKSLSEITQDLCPVCPIFKILCVINFFLVIRFHIVFL